MMDLRSRLPETKPPNPQLATSGTLLLRPAPRGAHIRARNLPCCGMMGIGFHGSTGHRGSGRRSDTDHILIFYVKRL